MENFQHNQLPHNGQGIINMNDDEHNNSHVGMESSNESMMIPIAHPDVQSLIMAQENTMHSVQALSARVAALEVASSSVIDFVKKVESLVEFLYESHLSLPKQKGEMQSMGFMDKVGTSKGKKPKAKTCGTPSKPIPGISTIILDVSSDSDDHVGTQSQQVRRSSNPNIKQKQQSNSLTKRNRSSGSKLSESDSRTPHRGMVGKKLTYTPSPTSGSRPIKIPKSEPMDEETSTQKARAATKHVQMVSTGARNQGYNPNLPILPTEIVCNFRPTPDMELTFKQAKMCAYLYHPELDTSDLMFKVGHTLAIRADFNCFCPGNPITPHAMVMKAAKATWFQKRKNRPCMWCLPPSFIVDVMYGTSIEELYHQYAREWMPPYPGLKYIYAPIEDDDHWFLIVMDIENQSVFLFDSDLPIEKVNPRRDIIGDVCMKLSMLIESSYYPMSYYKGVHMDDWSIVEPEGIPNSVNSYSSGVFVMDWMDMEEGFHSDQFGALNEDRVRMRMGLDMIMGPHNEWFEKVEARAEKFCLEIGLTPPF